MTTRHTPNLHLASRGQFSDIHYPVTTQYRSISKPHSSGAEAPGKVKKVVLSKTTHNCYRIQLNDQPMQFKSILSLADKIRIRVAPVTEVNRTSQNTS